MRRTINMPWSNRVDDLSLSCSKTRCAVAVENGSVDLYAYDPEGSWSDSLCKEPAPRVKGGDLVWSGTEFLFVSSSPNNGRHELRLWELAENGSYASGVTIGTAQWPAQRAFAADGEGHGLYAYHTAGSTRVAGLSIGQVSEQEPGGGVVMPPDPSPAPVTPDPGMTPGPSTPDLPDAPATPAPIDPETAPEPPAEPIQPHEDGGTDAPPDLTIPTDEDGGVEERDEPMPKSGSDGCTIQRGARAEDPWASLWFSLGLLAVVKRRTRQRTSSSRG